MKYARPYMHVEKYRWILDCSDLRPLRYEDGGDLAEYLMRIAEELHPMIGRMERAEAVDTSLVKDLRHLVSFIGAEFKLRSAEEASSDV